MEEGSVTGARLVLVGRRKRSLAIVVAMIMVFSSSPILFGLQNEESEPSSLPVGYELQGSPLRAGIQYDQPGFMYSTFMTPYDIALYWAPVWYQNTWSIQLDFFARINYDGDWDCQNNRENAYNYDLAAYVYYSFLETDTHYYIGYWDYHPMDHYAADTGGLGGIWSDAGQHENDMEGVLLVVAKTGGYGTVLVMETIAHLDFYQYKGSSSVHSGDEDFDGDDGWITWEGHQPVVYVEPGGHGVFGDPRDRPSYDWFDSGNWMRDYACKYVPGTTAEVPKRQQQSQTCQYALIAVDDEVDGFWQRRGQGPTFHSFNAFRGDNGYPNNAANAPWGQDDNDDADKIAGDIFFDPAGMFLKDFHYYERFDRTYIWNPFAIELTVVWYDIGWASDPDGGLSDAYLSIRMYDGRGEQHKLLDGQQYDFESWDPPLDPRFNPRGGTELSWIWWNAPLFTYGYPGFTFYGMAIPGREHFDIMSRDWDSDWDWVPALPGAPVIEDGKMPIYNPNHDEVLMGYWSSSTGTVEEDWYHDYWLMEGMNEYWWTGSAVGIWARGDGVIDDDSIAPQFLRVKTWPSTHLFATDARSIFFHTTIRENVGLSEVKFRYRANDSDVWSDWRTAYPTAARPDTSEFDYSFTMPRRMWLPFENHSILYQWKATDNDNDRPNDALTTISKEYQGPRISGRLPDGEVCSVSGNIIAFTTSEFLEKRDLNDDGDLSDEVIQYYDIRQELVVNTEQEGRLPCVSGNRMVAILQTKDLVPPFDKEVLGVYDFSSNRWRSILQDFYVVSLDLDGTTLVFEVDESLSSGPLHGIGCDFNKDGDKLDHLVMMCDLEDSGTIQPPRLIGIGRSPSVSADSQIIAYSTPESWVGDLNGNGWYDLEDIIRLYNYSSMQEGFIYEMGYSPSVGTTFDGHPFIAYRYQSQNITEEVFVLRVAVLEHMPLPPPPWPPDVPVEGWDMTAHADGDAPVCGISGTPQSGDAGMVVFESCGHVMKYDVGEKVLTDCQDLGFGPQIVGGYHYTYGSSHVIADCSLVAFTQYEPAFVFKDLRHMDLNFDGDYDDYVISLNDSRFGPLRALNPKIPVNQMVRTAGFVVDYFQASTAVSSSIMNCSVGVLFDQINSEGIARAEARPPGFNGPLLDRGFSTVGTPLELSTTVEYEGPVEVQVSYDLSSVLNENNLRLMQFNLQTSRWDDITAYVDKATRTVHGTTYGIVGTISIMEWTGVSPPVDIGLGLNPSMDGSIVAFELQESQAEMDLNGDSDLDDTVIHYRDLVGNVTTNTSLEGTSPSVSGKIIAFQARSDSGMDEVSIIRCMNLSAPGRTILSANDTEGFNLSANDTEDLNRSMMIRTLGIGESPSASGHFVAFQTSESQLGEDLNGDGNLDDVVIRYFDLLTNETVNTGIDGRCPVLSGTLILFLTDESATDTDINGDYDTSDCVLRCFDTSSMTLRDAVSDAHELSRSVYGDAIAFATDESLANADLNNDGDRLDRVIGYYDAGEDVVVETRAVGYAPSILEGRIAFAASESETNRDFNADGDKQDWILQYWNMTSCNVTNTRQSLCGPGFGLAIFSEGNMTTYVANETISARDINGDGDKSDAVVRLVGKKLPFGGLLPTSTKEFVLRLIGQDMQSSDDKIHLDFGAGALPRDMVVSMDSFSGWMGTPLWTLVDQPGLTLVSDVYRVGPVGTPLSPLSEVTIEYDEAKVNESNIRQLIAWSSPDGHTWQLLPSLFVDTERNVVKFQAPSLGWFAILRDNAKPRLFLKVNQTLVMDGDHFSAGTEMRLMASDFGAGVLYSCYRVNEGPWTPCNGTFRLDGPAGTCYIEYVSVDKAGNFGLIKSVTVILDKYSISGHVFLDRYCPGVWGAMDADEFGLGNWNVSLNGYTVNGEQVDLWVYTDNLNDLGQFGFHELCAGTYWVNLTTLTGYYYTSWTSREVVIEPTDPVETDFNEDFGALVPSPDPEVPFLLHKGWNLWSTPVGVDGLTAESLLAAIGPNARAVTRLDLTQGKYVSYVTGYSDSYDFPIIMGEGYFIWVKDTTHFTLKGVVPSSPSLQLVKGWNLIGYAGLRPMMASELLMEVQNSSARAVVYLDPVTGTYHSFVSGYSADFDFLVTPGRAYFIYTSGNGTISFG